MSNKSEKACAVAEVWVNAANAVVSAIKEFDFSSGEGALLKFQVEAIRRCALAQSHMIASQPNKPKFALGGVIGGGKTEGFVLNIDSDVQITKEQQEFLMNFSRSKGGEDEGNL